MLDGPSKTCSISIAARDRLKRWAEYLRSYTFKTIHIPGAKNHFCDLLSRNGCTDLVSTWQNVKHEGTSEATAEKGAHPQMAIITPNAIPGLAGRVRAGNKKKDLDISGEDLMLKIPTDRWPNPDRASRTPSKEQAYSPTTLTARLLRKCSRMKMERSYYL